jgi:hypothetical protein
LNERGKSEGEEFDDAQNRRQILDQDGMKKDKEGEKGTERARF